MEGNTQSTLICLTTFSLSHELPQYIIWKLAPLSRGTDAFQQILTNYLLHSFPPFCLVLQVLRKVDQNQTKSMLLDTPTWQSLDWHQTLIEMSVASPLLLLRNSLKKPTREDLPSSCLQNFAPSGMKNIWEKRIKKRVSKTAT